MAPQTERAPLQDTIDDLDKQATSPEDHEVVASWQRELDKERTAALGEIASTALPKLEQLRDGTIVTHEQAEADIHGDNPTQAPRRA